jgi:hypothetical protein
MNSCPMSRGLESGVRGCGRSRLFRVPRNQTSGDGDSATPERELGLAERSARSRASVCDDTYRVHVASGRSSEVMATRLRPKLVAATLALDQAVWEFPSAGDTTALHGLTAAEVRPPVP